MTKQIWQLFRHINERVYEQTFKLPETGVHYRFIYHRLSDHCADLCLLASAGDQHPVNSPASDFHATAVNDYRNKRE